MKKGLKKLTNAERIFYNFDILGILDLKSDILFTCRMAYLAWFPAITAS